MIKLIFKIVFFVLITAYLVGAYVYAQIEYEKEVCKKIEVVLKNQKENQYLSVKDIEDIILENNLVNVGDTLKSINRDKIETTIEKNIIVKNAECYLTTSGKIKIDVEQRIPIMRIITPTQSYYIDSDLKKLPLSDKIVAYVPVVTGNISQKFLYDEIIPFVTYIIDNEVWNNQIEQIAVTENNEIELIPRVGNQLILFGKISNFEQKFDLINSLYSKIFNNYGWNLYSKINLRYDGKIICTKNK